MHMQAYTHPHTHIHTHTFTNIFAFIMIYSGEYIYISFYCCFHAKLPVEMYDFVGFYSIIYIFIFMLEIFWNFTRAIIHFGCILDMSVDENKILARNQNENEKENNMVNVFGINFKR